MFRPHCLNNLNTVTRRVAKPFYSLCISFAIENRVHTVLGEGETHSRFLLSSVSPQHFLSTTGELFTSKQSCAEWVKTA